jgi:hypothetical protein
MPDTESGTTSSLTEQLLHTQTTLCVKCQFVFDHWYLRLEARNDEKPLYHTWSVEGQFHTLPQLSESAILCACCSFLLRGSLQLWAPKRSLKPRLKEVTGRLIVEYYRHQKHTCKTWVSYKYNFVTKFRSNVRPPWVTLEVRDSSGNTSPATFLVLDFDLVYKFEAR